jgi:putative NAD(P)H nitroreductase
MDFLKLINKRRACHSFTPGKSIPKEDLVEMINQTSLTPSGYNAQPWEFILIQEEKNIQKIGEIAFSQTHVKNSSAIIIVLGDCNIGRNVDALLQDWVKFGYCTEEDIPVFRNSIAKNRKPERLKKMALRNAMLASMTLIYSAENMGYATCPIMGFSQKDLVAHLAIPEDRAIALMVAIGEINPENQKPRLPRKSPEEMIHWEKF